MVRQCDTISVTWLAAAFLVKALVPLTALPIVCFKLATNASSGFSSLY